MDRDDIDQFLVRTHSTLNARQQAAQLGFHYNYVVYRRMILYRKGLISIHKRAYHAPWSTDQMEYLEEEYSFKTMSSICKRLNRSELAVILKKRRMGLTRTENFYTATMLARIFHVDPKKLIYLHQKGYLKGRRAAYHQGPSRPYVFQEEDVEAFIRAYPFFLVPDMNRKNECHYFRGVLREEWQRDPWMNSKAAAYFVGCEVDALLRAARRGIIKGYQLSPNSRWSLWWFRHSALLGARDRMRQTHSRHIGAAKKRLFQDRKWWEETQWQILATHR